MPSRSSHSLLPKLLLSLGTLVLLPCALEGGARLILLFLGKGEAPLNVGWSEPDSAEAAAGLRHRMFQPDPKLFFRLRPGLELEETVNSKVFGVRTNRWGMRGDECEKKKPPGTTRLLSVGDSCVFGSGADTDHTFPSQLGDFLRKLHPEKSIESLNSGVLGFTSFQARTYLESEGFDFEPDAVVIVCGTNDSMAATAGPKRSFGNRKFMTDREYSEAVKPPAPWAIQRLIQRLKSKPVGKAIVVDEDGNASAKRRVSREEYAENLRAMIQQCRARNIVPALVAWPMEVQVVEGEPRHRRGSRPSPQNPRFTETEMGTIHYQEIARQIAGEEQAVLVDLVELMEGHGEWFVDGLHLNAEGYGFVAERLARALGPHLF